MVDWKDRAKQRFGKTEAHQGGGKLHRGVSVFLVDSNGSFLIQKQSQKKLLWPGFLSNSVSTHPTWKESTPEAAKRAVKDKLGIESVELVEVFKFPYLARYGPSGSEFELVHVVIGSFDGQIRPSSEEIIEVRWLPPEQVELVMEEGSEDFTPCFRLAFPIVRGYDIARRFRGDDYGTSLGA